jgi:ADP-ribosylglycohydrolase
LGRFQTVLIYIPLQEATRCHRKESPEVTPMPTRTMFLRQPWLLYSREDLLIERQQAAEEGRDLASITAEFDAIAALPPGTEVPCAQAEALLDRVQALPMAAGYLYHEPSDLPGIRAARPAPVPLPAKTLSADVLRDKALGAWQGRAAGCLLGKPVEGCRAGQIEQYLKTQGRWPLDRYFARAGASPELTEACGLARRGDALFEEGITCMVEDDDTNYTVTGLALLQQSGRDFTPVDVARFWLMNIPLLHVCTAERIAYRNLTLGIAPPESAVYGNVYREWIGAQIRADFFGYCNPGDPETAADYAWRDAAISHVKNGIYGEMWVAAMLAAAYVSTSITQVIRAGLAQIPADCRLAAAIARLLDLHAAGLSYENAIAGLRERWDENNPHHWCHTISNAEIVAIALLWGGGDVTRTLGYSVMPGFDTDCNGATCGSILGVLLGAARLPAAWVAPLQDTLLTGVAGYHRVALTQLAEETVALCQEVHA